MLLLNEGALEGGVHLIKWLRGETSHADNPPSVHPMNVPIDVVRRVREASVVVEYVRPLAALLACRFRA